MAARDVLLDKFFGDKKIRNEVGVVIPTLKSDERYDYTGKGYFFSRADYGQDNNWIAGIANSRFMLDIKQRIDETLLAGGFEKKYDNSWYLTKTLFAGVTESKSAKGYLLTAAKMVCNNPVFSLLRLLLITAPDLLGDLMLMPLRGAGTTWQTLLTARKNFRGDKSKGLSWRRVLLNDNLLLKQVLKTPFIIAGALLGLAFKLTSWLGEKLMSPKWGFISNWYATRENSIRKAPDYEKAQHDYRKRYDNILGVKLESKWSKGIFNFTSKAIASVGVLVSSAMHSTWATLTAAHFAPGATVATGAWLSTKFHLGNIAKYIAGHLGMHTASATAEATAAGVETGALGLVGLSTGGMFAYSKHRKDKDGNSGVERVDASSLPPRWQQ